MSAASTPAERAILDALAAAPQGMTWWGIRCACVEHVAQGLSGDLLDLQARGVVVPVGEDSDGWTVYGLAAPQAPAAPLTPASGPEIATAGHVEGGGARRSETGGINAV